MFFIGLGISGIVYDFLPCAGFSTFLNAHLKEHNLSKFVQFVTVLCKTILTGLPSAIFFQKLFLFIRVNGDLKSKILRKFGCDNK